MSPPDSPNQCSTPLPASGQVILRYVSEGTSYPRFRLDFHHYTGVMGAICTSTPLRTSTTLSRRFVLPPYRSTGFGSHASDLGEHTRLLVSCEPSVSLRLPP